MVHKEDSVLKDRDKWLGGSDMQAVFTSRNAMVTLAYEKAFGIKKFFSNKWTDYGNLMEPVIRGVMEHTYGVAFDEVFDVRDEAHRIRGNVDGYSVKLNKVLEIKTAVPTKSFDDCVNQYKYQLLTYSYLFEQCDIILAVLRNDDFKPLIDTDSSLQYDEFTYLELLELCGLQSTEEFVEGVDAFWAEVTNQIKAGEVVVNTTIDALTEELREYEAEVTKYKSWIEEVKTDIRNEMGKRKYVNYNNMYCKFAIKEAHTRATIDKVKLTEDMGLAFVKKYSNISDVKESMSVTFKKGVDENGS